MTQLCNSTMDKIRACGRLTPVQPCRQMEKLLMGFHEYWHKDSLREGSGFMGGLSLPG